MMWLVALLALAVVFGAVYYRARKRALTEASDGDQQSQPTALLLEALALAGAVLVLAGGGVAACDHWRQLSQWEHVAIFAAASVIFGAVALSLQILTQPAVKWVIETSWMACICCLVTAAAIVAHDAVVASVAVTALTAGATITLCSSALWLAFRLEWQMTALVIGVVVTVSSAVLTVAAGSFLLAFSLGAWALGVGWATLGLRYPDPLWTTVPLAMATAIVAPGLAAWSHGWVFAVAIATAAAAMAASVPLRSTPLLTAGTLALLGYFTAAGIRFAHDLFGLPATLAVTGCLLLAVAVAAARLRHAMDSPAKHHGLTVPPLRQYWPFSRLRNPSSTRYRRSAA
jgi:hypothetical protein